MKAALKNLFNILIYCGVSKEEYKSVKIDAYKSNFTVWKYLHILVLVIAAFSFIPSVISNESLITMISRGVIFGYAVIATIFFFKVLKPESLLAQLVIYLSMSMVMVTGLLIAMQETTSAAVTFIVFLVIMPTFMIDKPYWMLLFLTVSDAVFLGVISTVKTGVPWTSDITNVIVYSVVGMIINVFYNNLRIRDFVTARKLEAERTDVIREQKAELELKQVELETALDEATKASKAKTAFLFNMSHDIRTPMNAIMGFTDLAMKNIDNKQRAMDALKKTKDSSEHLLNLINDILDMSRIESGKVEFSVVPINIVNIIENHLPMIRTLADRKEIKLVVDISDIKHKYLYADHLRLNQAIINIASNAVKYTNEGGTVWYRVYENDSDKEGYVQLNFEVKDTGCGMSEDYIPHIFDEFSREKTSTVTKQQGTGLGLAITKQLVTMAGGEIKVESKLGVGSTFTICVPLKVQENPEEEEQAIIDNSLDIDEALNNMKCLLVEDNLLNREISSEILKDVGLSVETAEDGSIAVAKVQEKGPDYYDFILMDIQMPVMDGYQATAKIREMYPDKHIPIIALSANAFEEDKKRSIEAGMDDHQSKPIVISLLIDSIKKFVRK